MKSKSKSGSGGKQKPTRPGKPVKPPNVPVPDPLPGTTKMVVKKPLPWPAPKKERPR
jgi:hypothetical protein